MSANFGRSKTFLTYGNKKMEGLSWKHYIAIAYEIQLYTLPFFRRRRSLMKGTLIGEVSAS